MGKEGWLDRKAFSMRLQKVAIAKFYSRIWPRYQITEIDELSDKLAVQIDIGGGDKLLRGSDGHLIFIGQRFRKIDQWNKRYRDFTIREAEYRRHLAAICDGGFVPGYYVLGYANGNEDDFIALYVINYRLWLEDIKAGILTMKFKKPYNDNQERFYFYCLEDIPDKYVVFRYIAEKKPIQDRLLV